MLVEKIRNITTSGKTLPTVVLIIIPSIFTVLQSYMVLQDYMVNQKITLFETGPASLLFVVVVLVYIFHPNGEKYFKTREYQKGIDEFEYIKKILLVVIPILVAVLLLYYFIYLKENIPANLKQIPLSNPIPLFLYFILLPPVSYIVVGGFLRIVLLIVRKDFRFYFAKGSFNIIPNKEEFEQMRYLRLGLDSYNKYLRRRLKYQISDNIIKQFYFKYIRATTQERNEMINSLLQAFEDGRTKPVTCISMIMKIPETEEFLTQETVGQKLKVIGTFLAATIPILISLIEFIQKFQKS